MTVTAPYLETAGWTLLHFVWQGAAIAAVMAALLRLLERRSSNARYLVACAGLSAMLAAPAFTARILWSSIAEPVAADVTTAQAETPRMSLPEISRPRAVDSIPQRARAARGIAASAFAARLRSVDLDRLLRMLTVAWLLGVVTLLVRMAGGWWHVRTLHRAALATPSSRWQTSCRRLAYRLGLPAAAHVIESAAVDVPTVVGVLRPAIILPIAALAALTPAQVEAILAHELAHIRRHDYAVNLLQTIAETLLFYHPAVWWMSSRIRAEREHCCDEVAVALCGDAIGYAQALTELEEWRSASTRMALAATGGSLLDRVRRILHVPIGDEPRSPGWAATLALTMIFTAGAGSVQHLPSWILSRVDARAYSASAVQPQSIAIEAALPGDQQHSASATTDATPTDATAQPPIPPDPPEPPQPPDPPEPPDFDDVPPVPPAPPVSPSPPGPPAPPRDSDAVAIPPPAPPSPPVPPAPPAPPARPSAAPPAPPVPPAPQAPPAPPAPPASPSDAFGVSSKGRWHLQWSDGLSRMDVTLNGTVTFTDDLTDVATLSDGGRLTIRTWSGIVPHTIEIRSENGTITRTYYVAGLSRGWDEQGRQRLATDLPALVRRSGIGAESRVKSILQKKGVTGVLDEIELLGGDYARRLYLVALVDAAHLDAGSIQPVLTLVGQRITSDYDRRLVLQYVASHVTLNQRAASAYLQAMTTMRSDYDRRMVLTTLFSGAGHQADASDLLTAIDGIRSSYDKRQVLSQLIARGSLDGDMKQGVLQGAAGVQSDYDRCQVLQEYVDRFGVEPVVAAPFFAAVNATKSAYYRRRVLMAVAKSPSLSREVERAAFESIATMSSDYDRAETLLAFIGSRPLDSSTREAFIAAAETIRSSHDQSRVLAALVRAERR